MIPFIKAYHENDEIVFWPDLASSHYAKDTIDFLKSNNIDFVDKSSNPANAPELRPIEDFWVEMKRVVYANGWRADNLDQLTNRINYAFKKSAKIEYIDLDQPLSLESIDVAEMDSPTFNLFFIL